MRQCADGHTKRSISEVFPTPPSPTSNNLKVRDVCVRPLCVCAAVEAPEEKLVEDENADAGSLFF